MPLPLRREPRKVTFVDMDTFCHTSDPPDTLGPGTVCARLKFTPLLRG